MSDLVGYVRGFRRHRVLVLGDAMLDSYLEGTASRLCSEGPVPVVQRTAEDHAPGGAANSAANLRALGADVRFLGAVGPDETGRLLRHTLQERGVDDRYLVEDPGIETVRKTRVLADEQYVVRFDTGTPLDPAHPVHERLLAQLGELYPPADIVIIADYRYGVASDRLLAGLTKLRRDHPRPLVVDSKALGRFARAGATIVTPNHREARMAVDAASAHDGPPTISEVTEVARRLLDLIDASHVAVTMAGDGVLLHERDGESMHIPAHPVARANDVGAGDSFTAALALTLASGGTPADAVRVGVSAGELAVTKRRTAPVSHQELLQRVSLYDGTPGPSLDELARTLHQERLQGRTIVFTNGVFDILHAGHVRFLEQAKSLGDILVVGVNSDRSARALKGTNRPINSERDRLALVSALDSVDHALTFDEDTPATLIRALRPAIHVKGGDYEGEELPEAEAVEEVGGRLVVLPLHGSLSTSRVIDRIVTLARDDAVELAG